MLREEFKLGVRTNSKVTIINPNSRRARRAKNLQRIDNQYIFQEISKYKLI